MLDDETKNRDGSASKQTMRSQAIRHIPEVLIPQQQWALVAWLFMGTAFVYINTVAVTRTAWDDVAFAEFNHRVWGWPFIHSNSGEGAGLPFNFSLYLIAVDVVVCVLMLASTGNFLECYVHRWMKNRRWTLGDMLQTITAAAPFCSLALLIWDTPQNRFPDDVQGTVHDLRDLPVYLMLPVMFGIFCVAHAACGFVYRFLRCGLRLDRPTEKDGGSQE